MSRRSESQVRPVRDSQRGQALVIMLFCLVGLLSMAAFVIDIGGLYYSHQELVAATDAAALAGGAAVPAGNATSVAAQYSAASGDLNNRPNLQNVSVTSTLECLTATGLGLPPCSVYGSQPSANAIQVTETATVSTFFAKIFGVKSVNISATATASAKGGGGSPYHIMMVLDTTHSMGTGTDTGCVTGSSKSYSPEQCAQFGIQTLLGELDPCAATLASCGTATNGLTANPVDQVGLTVFPGLCSDTASGVTTSNCPAATSLTNTTANSTYAPPDYSCPSTAPPIAAYNNNPEYMLLGFQNNYRSSDSAALATVGGSSNLVNAAGAGISNCGLATPGGEGTFYAGAIYAARDYLYANHTTNVQDIMIFLSDGDANATSTELGGSVRTDGLPLFTTTAECQQAVTAATSAKGAPYNIQIYSISYGSETTGCTTGDTLTPCGTMAGIASSPLSQYFFSVPQTVNGVTSTVCSGARPDTALNQVFTDIAADLTAARLIPNGTT
jgi:Putative Flp pilus-assembly TadE/G-like